MQGVSLLGRDLLTQQVKSEYARLVQLENREHVVNQSYNDVSPEAYYEETLEKAVRDISVGKYDNYISDQQVVERITNRNTKARRTQNIIESTLCSMEITKEIMTLKPDDKNIQDPKEKNKRRAGAIPQMIHEMKEELAREELDAESPSMIRGGGNG